ncbi:pyruvate ferredoxin oxidoreductase [Candidatus Woesearchaeota archaeon]|nr:pyruvate ferredoxin oxidoreductase [Candidatus Woesearchaeota archaeon]
MIDLLDGNQCAAIAAKLARVKCVPCFPITPQTEIIETIQKWVVDGEWKDVQFNQLESEHSAMSAAFGAQITGVRTFTATSSQGLFLMHEMLPIIAGARAPMVLVNVSRGVSSPITLWPDHNDVLAMRDTGFITYICETNQEVLDSIIIAYKVGENKNISLPSIVNMDGFIHSYTRTQVDVPKQSLVDKFLPKLKMAIKLDTKKPMTLGIPVLGDYMKFRIQLHKAQLDAFNEIKKVHNEWYKLTKRKYEFVEMHKLKDAKAAIVIMGPNTTIARAAVDNMRKKGKMVGLLRIRLYRPFPEKEIKDALKNIPNIAVVDQNICPGMSGISYPEVKSAMYGQKNIISNYIAGLGGKALSQEEFEEVLEETLNTKQEVRKWLM